MARQNAPTFAKWQKSPAGLSAQGFGKIGPTIGQGQAKAELLAKSRRG